MMTMARGRFLLRRAVRLVWQCAPGWTVLNMVLVILQGLLPLATLCLIKRIIDTVTASKTTAAAAASSPRLSAVLPPVALAGEAQSASVSDKISDILHAQSVAVDLGYYEDTRYQDTLHRAQQEASYRPPHLQRAAPNRTEYRLLRWGRGSLVRPGLARGSRPVPGRDPGRFDSRHLRPPPFPF